jgi:16S rRNA (cytidine1402-2'-O)-methyltransferase
LAASGLPTGRFTFEGFLATNKKNRRAHLDALGQEERTMLFYEAPHKLRATLADLTDAFGPDRRVALCRELTKLHEEILRTTLGQAAELYTQREPKGEYVLVVEGAPPAPPQTVSPEDALRRVEQLRAQGQSLKTAVKQAAQELSVPRNLLYGLALSKGAETP